jgi:hypothetical protein
VVFGAGGLVMRVLVRCWNCEEPNRSELESGGDPKCRKCRKRLLASPFDGRDLPANAELEPLVEPLRQGLNAERVGFTCPFCGSHKPPAVDTKVSTMGWIVFTILVLSVVGVLLCWLAMRIREPYYFCQDCDLKLD